MPRGRYNYAFEKLVMMRVFQIGGLASSLREKMKRVASAGTALLAWTYLWMGSLLKIVVWGGCSGVHSRVLWLMAELRVLRWEQGLVPSKDYHYCLVLDSVRWKRRVRLMLGILSTEKGYWKRKRVLRVIESQVQEYNLMNSSGTMGTVECPACSGREGRVCVLPVQGVYEEDTGGLQLQQPLGL